MTIHGGIHTHNGTGNDGSIFQFNRYLFSIELLEELDQFHNNNNSICSWERIRGSGKGEREREEMAAKQRVMAVGGGVGESVGGIRTRYRRTAFGLSFCLICSLGRTVTIGCHRFQASSVAKKERNGQSSSFIEGFAIL